MNRELLEPELADETIEKGTRDLRKKILFHLNRG
jgi:hypothetical protein